MGCRKLCLASLIVAVAAGFCVAQSEAPSLADLARQNRTHKKATKVFTEEDVPHHASPAPAVVKNSDPTVSSSKVGGADVQAAGKAVTADDNKADSPAVKPSADSELKQKLDHYTAQRDAWKQSVKRYEELLANDKDSFRRQTYEDALSVDRQNVASYQAKIDEVQNALAKSDSNPASDVNGGEQKGSTGSQGR
jgi:hypothetical protein